MRHIDASKLKKLSGYNEAKTLEPQWHKYRVARVAMAGVDLESLWRS